MATNDIATWAVFGATLGGPVLAVQAQKWLEYIKERKSRKTWIVQTLMATQGQRLSLEHVRALNMIDLTFYGTKFNRRTENEQEVIDTWRAYRTHLSAPPNDQSEVNMANWISSGNELFFNLLHALVNAVGYKFTREELKASGYSPIAHGYAELETNQLRQNALRVMTGQQALKLDVTSFPINNEISKAHANIQTKLLTALEKGSLSVEIKKEQSTLLN
jgi:hypothetical protein